MLLRYLRLFLLSKLLPKNPFYAGFCVLIDDYVSTEIFLTDSFDTDVFKSLSQLLRKRVGSSKMVAIDGGANLGAATLVFAKFFDEVYAIEPNPRLSTLLVLNCGSLPNVVISEVALSSKAKKAKLYVDPKNWGGGYITDNQVPDSAEGMCQLIDVHMACGDEILERVDVNSIKLIKLDVEGYELEAIRGLRSTILKSNPAILLEVHAEDVSSGTTKTIEYLRRQAGYRFAYCPSRRWFSIFDGSLESSIKWVQLKSLKKKFYGNLLLTNKPLPEF